MLIKQQKVHPRNLTAGYPKWPFLKGPVTGFPRPIILGPKNAVRFRGCINDTSEARQSPQERLCSMQDPGIVTAVPWFLEPFLYYS